MEDSTAKQLAELKRREAELISLEGENTRIAEAGYTEHSKLYQENLAGVRRQIGELSGENREAKLPPLPPDNGVDLNDPRFEHPMYRGQ